MENNISDKIRKHWVWLAIIIIGTVIKVTWEVENEIYIVPQDKEIARLNRRITELEQNKIVPKAKEVPPKKLITQEQITQPEEKLLSDWSKEGGLFNKNNPYPKKYEKVKIGTKISVMKNVYPTATYTSATQTWYVTLPDGPFDLLRFAVNSSADRNDPKITSVIFYFRRNSELDADKNARQYVIDQALQYFGSETVVSKMLGEEMEWLSVKGVRVKIDTYRFMLSQAKK